MSVQSSKDIECMYMSSLIFQVKLKLIESLCLSGRFNY